MRLQRSLSALVILAWSLGTAAACSKQGEGERCDTNNGNADCESGFECTTTEGLTGLNPKAPKGSAICCPPTVPAATTDACRSRGSLGIGGAAGPTAAGTVDAGASRGGGNGDGGPSGGARGQDA